MEKDGGYGRKLPWLKRWTVNKKKLKRKKKEL
jgi:hypothetical protein